MQKDLYIKDKPKRKIFVKADDLSFDGKNLIIPSYWVGSLHDYILAADINSIPEVDRQDFNQFKDFLFDVEEFMNQGN